jgi:hypothetical protein
MRDALDDVGAVRFRHPGKHRYATALGEDRAQRAAVTIVGGRDHRSYPKRDRGQLDLFDPWDDALDAR